MNEKASRKVEDVADDLAALAGEARELGEHTLAYLIDMAIIEARSRLISEPRLNSPLP